MAPEISGFFNTLPLYEFRWFSEKSHSDDGYSYEKSYVGYIRNNPKILSSYHICDFSSKMTI